MPLTHQVDAWLDRTITDALGHKIGKIHDVYTDDDTGRPEWLAVTIGRLGSDVRFVPVRGATSGGGGGVQVPYHKDQVRDAPPAGAAGRLSRQEEARLYGHYGISYAAERTRLQRDLGSDPPHPPPARRAAVLDLSTPPPAPPPVARPEQRAPAGARGLRLTDFDDDAEPDWGNGQAERGGRWPDDEAIFGLSEERVPGPDRLAPSTRPG